MKKNYLPLQIRFIFFLLFSCIALLSFGVGSSFADVTIDNGESGTSYTGTWKVSGGTTPYGGDSLYSRDGATYTWQFDSEPAGTYEVLMWWSGYASRATGIPVDINHGVGTETMSINQNDDAGQWNSLGQYYFNTSGSVTITAAYGSSVSTCADAVWFRFISDNTPPSAYIDTITPDPAEPGETIEFSGYGTDNEGSIAAYRWESSIDGPLSNLDTFTTSSLSQGTHTISFRVQDDEGLWSEAVTQVLTVGTIPTEIIIDNRDSQTSRTGTWKVSGGPDPYGADSVWSRDGTTFTWNFYPPRTGDYEVFMWWTEYASRSDEVPVTIYYEGSSETFNVDQRYDGGQWNSLGVFHFDMSSGGSVRVTAAYGSSVSTCADAVKFNFVQSGDPPMAVIESIVPNPANVGEDINFMGHGEDSDGTVVSYSWDSSINGHLSDVAFFSTASLSQGTHTITFKVQDNEDRWSAPVTDTVVVGNPPNIPPVAVIESITPNPANTGEMVTFTGHGEDSDGVIDGCIWESSMDGILGTADSCATDELSQGTHTITFTVFDDDAAPSDPVTQVLTVGDAPNEVVIDNGSSGTSSTGIWKVSGASDPYGNNSVYSRDGATYTWTFSPTVSSFYQVFMWWTDWSSRSTNVPVEIPYDTGASTTVYIDQQQNGGQWNNLGTFFFEAGSDYGITITSQPYPSSTCADAVKFVKSVDPNTVPPVADFVADKTVGGVPTTIQFTDQSTGTVTQWLWDFGGGQTSTQQNPSHQYTQEGYYTVSLTVTNSYGSNTKTRGNYIQITDGMENIYIFDGYSKDAFLTPWCVNVLQNLGAVENNGVWVYTNPGKNVTYYIRFPKTEAAMMQALKEEGAHIIYNGHSNYGLGAIFATLGEVYSQHLYDILYVDDDRIINISTDMVSLKVDGMKYGQAYPNWNPILSNLTSAVMPYDFSEGTPPHNYYLTYKIPGDPTLYKVELPDGSFIERFPDSNTPAWYSPDGLPPDPVANPEYFITNPYPYYKHCEFIGSWSMGGDGKCDVNDDQCTYERYNYHYHQAGSGSNTATWILVVEVAGNYDVYATWQFGSGNATNAKYTIQHSNGYSIVNANQQDTQGKGYLGQYHFDVGPWIVELSDDANGRVVADSVQLISVDDPDEVVYTDNSFDRKFHIDQGTSGKVIIDASSATIPENELRYSRMFYASCNSGPYYIGKFHRGIMFFTINSQKNYTAHIYLNLYLRGHSDESILSSINAASTNGDIYRYYNFDLKPPSLR